MSSIYTPFEIDAGIGRVRAASRSAYIRQLMIQVLLTSPGERVARPTFGSWVRQLVFAANHPVAATLAEVAVFQALRTWMSELIEIGAIDVVGDPAQGSVSIEITYRELASGRSDVLNVEVR